MRVVVDTKVLVSGLLSSYGPPGVIVGLIATGRLRSLAKIKWIFSHSLGVSW